MTRRSIRSLQESDIARLQKIDAAAHGEAWSYRMFLDEVERPDRVHLVAEHDVAIVGHAAAWIDDRSCRITNVAVAANESGQGHATALLLALVSQTMTEHRVMNLQLEVRPTNRRAQRMYGRFGFVPIGVERNFYDRSDVHGSRDAVVMVVADVCSDLWRSRLETIQADQAPRAGEAA
jgi:ribosomal-protein-alanine N-acetyltransferase